MSPDLEEPARRPTFEESVSAFGLLLMLVLVSVEIVKREAFNTSYLWAEEVARYLMVWSVYFGASAAVASGEHLRIDMLLTRVSPAVRRRLDLIAQLWVLAFSAALTYAGFLYVRDSFAFGFVSADSNLTLEMGWIQLVIPITFALSAFHALRLALRLLRGERHGRAREH
jgi:C4-dicarboxylate transporter DctQ subunit